MKLYSSDDTIVEILEGRLARLYELTLPEVIGVSDIGWTDEQGFLGGQNPAKLIPVNERAERSFVFTANFAQDFNYQGSYAVGDNYKNEDSSPAVEQLTELIVASDKSDPLIIKVGGGATDVVQAIYRAQVEGINVLDGRIQVWADLFVYTEDNGWSTRHFNNSFDYEAAADLIVYDEEQQENTGIPLLYVIPLDQIMAPRKVSKIELRELAGNHDTVGANALQYVLDEWENESYYPNNSESSSGLGHTLMILNQDIVEIRQVEAPTFDLNGKILSQDNDFGHLLHVVRDIDKPKLDLLIHDALFKIASFEGHEGTADPDPPDGISYRSFPIDLDGVTVDFVNSGHASDLNNVSFDQIIGKSFGTILLPLAPPANDPDGEPIVWDARIHLHLDGEDYISYEVNPPSPSHSEDDLPFSVHTKGRNGLELTVLYEDTVIDLSEEIAEIESYLSMSDTLIEEAIELAENSVSVSNQAQAQLNKAQQLLSRLLEI